MFGHDHRGHGASEGERGYFADDNGWHKVVEDVRIVNDHIREIHATAPLIMLQALTKLRRETLFLSSMKVTCWHCPRQRSVRNSSCE